MDSERILYICPMCFKVCESEQECHAHTMLACDIGELGAEQRKPVKDRFGNYVSRAPRWFLDAAGWLPGKKMFRS